MQTSDPDINNNVNADVQNDEFIDSIEAHQAIKIDERSGNTLFRDAIRSEVLDNLISNTGTLKPISQEYWNSETYLPGTITEIQGL